MSFVKIYINYIEVTVDQLPPSPQGLVNASFYVTADPSPGNPFGMVGDPIDNNFQITINVDANGNVLGGLAGAQLVFVFTPAPSPSLPFGIVDVAMNQGSSLPLYMAGRMLSMGSGAGAVIMTIPPTMCVGSYNPDYTVTIALNSLLYQIDPDIGVEVQN